MANAATERKHGDGGISALDQYFAGHIQPVLAHALTSEGHDASEDGTGRGTPIVPVHASGCGNSNNLGVGRPGGPMHALDSTGDAAIAFAIQERAVSENAANGPQGKGWQEERAFTMEARHHSQATASKGGVRRLTPTECARLQGFPDSWLDDLGLSDSAKYRMLGNAVAVPVAEWIGKRLIGVTP